MSYTDVETARQRVCNAGKQLLKEGLVARTWGNVSLRVSEDEMVITPSGRQYEDLQPKDMVLVNIHNLKYEGIKPSSELKLHCQLYKTRSEVMAVIHTHQMYASIIAAAQKDVEVIEPEHQKVLGASVIRSAPYALPNTKKITVETAKAVGNTNAALMANHGVVCAGKSLDEAFDVARTLEEACKLFLETAKAKQTA